MNAKKTPESNATADTSAADLNADAEKAADAGKPAENHPADSEDDLNLVIEDSTEDNPDTTGAEKIAEDKTATGDTATAAEDKGGDPADIPAGVFVFDGKVIAAATTQAAETAIEKALREQNEALIKQLSDLQNTAQQQQQQQPDPVLPNLYDEGIDGDQELFKAALDAYVNQKVKRGTDSAIEENARLVVRARNENIFNIAVQEYEQRLKAAQIAFPDILTADQVLAAKLPQTHQAAIMDAHLNNSEMVVYALYKVPELLKVFLEETSQVRMGAILKDISQRVKTAPAAKEQEVKDPPVVNGNSGAQNTDDFNKLFPDAVIE